MTFTKIRAIVLWAAMIGSIIASSSVASAAGSWG
jgi:hypothetical protein